ncbi:hypothetical protein FR483_n833R [Paramecium bursaria Chlorella virus FR483]|uniref:Uncharacterized protein n833R n=1 Tax=Paramecium bursaria Chlorella virus FR483 TaxID=399781 RepID=A7J8I7_PBCVF|nr:hypothetical protein FR483_n833R [Paramecium bursaria Chlorella virus FR483]ABT16118.1 hypothetical protein FR483_n833R [Paramecium bursaria Chlorella virus FR483]
MDAHAAMPHAMVCTHHSLSHSRQLHVQAAHGQCHQFAHDAMGYSRDDLLRLRQNREQSASERYICYPPNIMAYNRHCPLRLCRLRVQ